MINLITATHTIEVLKNLLEPHGLTLDLEFDETTSSIKGNIITANAGIIPVYLYQPSETADWLLEQAVPDLSLPSFSDLNGFVGDINLAEIFPDSLFNIGNIKLSSLEMKFPPEMASLSHISFAARIDNWILPLGIVPPTVDSVAINFAMDNADISGNIQGHTKIGNGDVTLQGELKNGLLLSAKLASIELAALVNSLAGPVLQLPSGFPDVVLPETEFLIQFVGDIPFFALRSQLDGFGLVTMVIQKINDQWETAVVFVLPSDWKFSRLSPVLQPLDLLRITPPILTLASFDAPDFVLPKLNGEAQILNIKKDLSLYSVLKLQGLGLDFIGRLIGKEELPLQLSTVQSLADAEISANFNQTIDILPDVIVFDRIALVIDPNPLSISLDSQATVTIQNTELPKFKTSAAIEEGSTKLSLETIEPWENLFGIRGLSINKVILEMETSPAPKYGILGDITISDKTIQMAAQFIGSAPSMIAGELEGHLSLQDTVDELVGLSLPDILDISIRDFKIFAVADPSGVTIGDAHFDPGLALQGTLGFIGLETFVKVIVDPDNGVFAHGSLTEIISFDNILIISNATGDAPPTATLDTRIPTPGATLPPLLQISGMYNLLGLKGSIDASVDNTGIAFAMERALGLVQYKWAGTAKPPNFTTEGSFNFGIKETIGPIKIPSDLNLGKISLDAGFDGSASMSLIGGQFLATITGGFHFQGLNLEIPTITLDIAPESLEKFPELVIAQIKSNAKDIFAEFLGSPDKWLLSIRDEVVEGVENVAKVLSQQFNRTTEQIGADIRNTLGRGSAAAAQELKDIGESAEKIAVVLKDLGDSSEKARSALSDAGFTSENISLAMQAAFPDIPHIDFPAQGHLDTPLTPHIDTPLTPHIDTPLIPHVDTPLIPHADRSKQGHVDFPSKGHIDIPGQGHIDFREGHVDFRKFGAHGDIAGIHGDTTATPHLDTPFTPHGDTPLIPHLDSRAVGHGDVAAVGHGDVAAVGHGDVAAVGHGDVAAVGHGDAPAIPHGDAP